MINKNLLPHKNIRLVILQEFQFGYLFILASTIFLAGLYITENIINDISIKSYWILSFIPFLIGCFLFLFYILKSLYYISQDFTISNSGFYWGIFFVNFKKFDYKNLIDINVKSVLILKLFYRYSLILSFNIDDKVIKIYIKNIRKSTVNEAIGLLNKYKSLYLPIDIHHEKDEDN